MVSGGGSVQLGQLIDEHGAALVHDLQGLGVDLRDLWRPGATLTPRYVLWLTEQLPDTSAFVASCRGGRQWRPWTFQNQLAAAAVNQLGAANYQRAGKRPKTLITPPKETKPRKTRVVTVAEIVARQKKNQTSGG